MGGKQPVAIAQLLRNARLFLKRPVYGHAPLYGLAACEAAVTGVVEIMLANTEFPSSARATISLMHRFSVSQHKIISCTLLWTNFCYRMSLTLTRL